MASAKRAVTRSSLPDGLGVRRDWVNMSSNHLSMSLVLFKWQRYEDNLRFWHGNGKKSDFCEKRLVGVGGIGRKCVYLQQELGESGQW